MVRRIFLALAVFALALLPAHAAATRTELVASAVQAASATSAPFSISTASNLMIGVDLTACGGSTVATMWLQGSDDGGVTWYDYPADLVLQGKNAADTGTISAAPGRRNIIDTLTCGSTLTLVPYVAIYKNIATDRVRLKWILSAVTTGITFSASMVAK